MAITLATQIENYIKRLLELSEDGSVELRRADLADMFMCVPSQINYVLNTRFGAEAGYFIETRRGGSGYVRIIQTGLADNADLTVLLAQAGDKPMNRQAAANLLTRLLGEEIITKREYAICRSLFAGDALKLAEDREDLLRGRMVRLLLMNLIRDDLSD
ncbi:MAG: CtsR family transcriptional regulator [Firmicutes bacterium]|nr:CtsR family transcriptional regulator [Bacillota bacterium]